MEMIHLGINYTLICVECTLLSVIFSSSGEKLKGEVKGGRSWTHPVAVVPAIDESAYCH